MSRGDLRHLPLWLALAVLLLDGRAPASAAQPVGSQSRSTRGPATAAWKWTVEERLAKRFDPESMAARAREQAAEREANRTRFPEGSDDPLFKVDDQVGPPLETINGRKTPELFLTWELFTDLIDRGLSGHGQLEQTYRGRIEGRAAALGFGQDLWPRLERAAAPFLELRHEAERSRPSLSTKTDLFNMDAEGLRGCRMRAQAIAAAKREFGETAFLRLLYEAVAPNLQTTGMLAPGLAEHLRFLEGGCQ